MSTVTHATIELVNGRGTALVDPTDFERLGHHRWYLVGEGVVARVDLEDRKRRVYLHREVLDLTPADPYVDHINRNKLDCRRSNLRLVTNALNKQNLSSYKGSSSRYRGVSRDTKRGQWKAGVRINGREIYRGYFDDELEAAKHCAVVRLVVMPNTCQNDLELAIGTPMPRFELPPPHDKRPSPGRGVSWDMGTSSWRAQVNHGGKLYYLGVHADVRDALRVAQEGRRRRAEGLPLDRTTWVDDYLRA